jgi:uncharacterized phage-associated protein
MFEELRAAQMAAYFLDRAQGRMPVLKLMKLMYLADRKSLAQHGHPITFDRMVSMDHGPILSTTYDLTQGAFRGQPQGWEYWISERENHDLGLRRQVARDALEDLSDADIDVLNDVWNEVGHLGKWELVDYTHAQLKEWRFPDGSSLPIEYEDVFRALGRPEHTAKEMADNLLSMSRIRRNVGR